ncbi:bcl-2-related protein A1 [Hemicordylus capensis]|uniref:bcl-2-related protein A1 n=1 Tax=Hemicordylus capensis TaxID=884348 RepID=UPI0023046A2A|nr:bcl-2-related protein A1 [Hemicordylus capensis]
MERGEFLCVSGLVQDYLKYVSQETQPEAAPNRIAQVLRKVASSHQGKVEEALKPLLGSLELRSVDDASRIFSQVMQEQFADGIVNWGRILTIFIFGGILAKKLQKGGGPLARESTEQISHFITDYIVNTKAAWIKDNGGWDDGFVAKFDDESHWLSLHNVKTKIMAVFLYFSQYL